MKGCAFNCSKRYTYVISPRQKIKTSLTIFFYQRNIHKLWIVKFIRKTSDLLQKNINAKGPRCSGCCQYLDIYVPDLDNVTLFRTQARRKKKFDILPPYLLGTSLHDINTSSYMSFLSDLVYIIIFKESITLFWFTYPNFKDERKILHLQNCNLFQTKMWSFLIIFHNILE